MYFLILFCITTCHAQQTPQLLNTQAMAANERLFAEADRLRRGAALRPSDAAANLYRQIIHSAETDWTTVDPITLLKSDLGLADILQASNPTQAEEYYRFVLAQESTIVNPAVFAAARIGLAELLSRRIFALQNLSTAPLQRLIDPVFYENVRRSPLPAEIMMRAHLLQARLAEYQGNYAMAFAYYLPTFALYTTTTYHDKHIAYHALAQCVRLLSNYFLISPDTHVAAGVLKKPLELMYPALKADPVLNSLPETMMGLAVSLAWMNYLFPDTRGNINRTKIEKYLNNATHLYNNTASHTPNLTATYLKGMELRAKITKRPQPQPAQPQPIPQPAKRQRAEPEIRPTKTVEELKSEFLRLSRAARALNSQEEITKNSPAAYGFIQDAKNILKTATGENRRNLEKWIKSIEQTYKFKFYGSQAQTGVA